MKEISLIFEGNFGQNKEQKRIFCFFQSGSTGQRVLSVEHRAHYAQTAQSFFCKKDLKFILRIFIGKIQSSFQKFPTTLEKHVS